jgi:hypothetical protein
MGMVYRFQCSEVRAVYIVGVDFRLVGGSSARMCPSAGLHVITAGLPFCGFVFLLLLRKT